MCLDPVADLRCAGEIRREARGRETDRRILAESRTVSERYVEERHQQAPMRTAARIGVLWQNPQADDEPAVIRLAIEIGARRFKERARAKQRLEAGRGVRRVLHGARSIALKPTCYLDRWLVLALLVLPQEVEDAL